MGLADHHECNAEGDCKSHMEGWLYLQPLLHFVGMQKFAKRVSKYTSSRFDIIDEDLVDLTYSVTLHDAIMLYAHAATEVLQEGGK